MSTPAPLPADPFDPRPVVGAGVVILRASPAGPEVLLIRRGKAPRLGEWSIPGGRQEPGETVRAAAIREVQEETALIVDNLRLIDVVDVVGGSSGTQWVLVDFRADWTSGEAFAGGDAAAVQWVPLADLARYGLWSETVRVIEAGAALR
jgi:8-oxo-dGTP diphosphatase